MNAVLRALRVCVLPAIRIVELHTARSSWNFLVNTTRRIQLRADWESDSELHSASSHRESTEAPLTRLVLHF